MHDRPRMNRHPGESEGDDSRGNEMNQNNYKAKKRTDTEGNNNQNLTSLAETILNKTVSAEEKEKCIERGMLLLDEYGIDKVMIKGSGSRLIQACLKYGNTTSKEVIFLKLMKSNMETVLTDHFGSIVSNIRQVHSEEDHGAHQEQEAVRHFR